MHAPTNIAGIAGLLSRAQRDLGFDSTSIEYVSHKYAFETDRTLHLGRGDNAIKKAAAVGGFALNAIREYDIFHLYFGNTLFPFPYPDLTLLRALGKTIVFHFCGCEVRNRAATLSKYRVSGCSECTSLVCLGKHHPNPALADVTLVSTPDLLEFVPGAHLMPGPIDLQKWSPRPPRTTPISPNDPVRILHAPSDREIKGTRFLLQAVERLKDGGYPVELMMLEGVPHDKVAEFCGEADIAVDQLMIGAYGTVSIEMMAKGVPVVCRIRDDLRCYYPQNLPIVSAGPEEIYDRLESLVTHPDSWAALGSRGISYVQQEHEMHRVAARVLDLYGVGVSKQTLLTPTP
ncbi:MAG: glycosyltransferase family 4 protein [Chloroflexi bacterium]|nr:glycosyltransferase family 4 protein [Chloroflexota bacterium]